MRVRAESRRVHACARNDACEDHDNVAGACQPGFHVGGASRLGLHVSADCAYSHGHREVGATDLQTFAALLTAKALQKNSIDEIKFVASAHTARICTCFDARCARRLPIAALVSLD
jgi:hypothetical protein